MKTDTKGILIAEIGCVILGIATLINFKYNTILPFEVLAISCLCTFGVIILKDSRVWENAIEKMFEYNKSKLTLLNRRKEKSKWK